MKQQEILAQLVRDLRARTGFTQVEIADRCSFSRDWLNAVEQARVKQPNREWLTELAISLNVEPIVLLKAAGYRVGTPPKVRPRTLADILQEAAIHARGLEERGDPESKAELRQVADLFKPLVHFAWSSGVTVEPSRVH